MKVLDLFAGAGGATVGMSLLGMDIVGVDHEPDACRTHLAAGHATIRADLTNPVPVRGDFYGVWASPPCTAFSMAGKGEGRDVAEPLIEAIHREDWSPWDSDPSVWLILPTMQAILDLAPQWVAMENVPATQPVMDACARVLERHGYRATTVVLSSERFGVAQTRKRCFLIANRDGYTLPEPTHQAYRHGEPAALETSLFGDVLPWVSMAEALGWGTPERPYFTLALGGDSADTSGGGSGARASLRDLSDRESWVMDVRQVGAFPRSTAYPAPTMLGEGMSKGVPVWRSDPMDNACRRELDQPAGTLKHGHEPPSWETTADPIRLTVDEAARLQAFPADHPWQGSRTSTFRQIGNAVPCPMGAVVAGSAAGIDWHEPVAAYLSDLYAAPVTRAEEAA